MSSHTQSEDEGSPVPFFPPPADAASRSVTRPSGGATTTAERDRARVRSAMDEHYEAVWRFLRRLGVASPDVDDAAQKVFLVFASRVAAVEVDSERSFLFGSAVRVASDARRKRARSRESLATDGETIDIADPSPSAEDGIDDRRLRRWLDEVLATLSEEQRAVLVLVDIEEQTMAEASHALGIPRGTVASRLRRARELFEQAANALRARLQKEV
ncbi:MAG: polymerase sigma factor RpoE [Labilithrix sp.]|nr:polymerase sigma factor RpoE [Labilithrix sp.]